MRRGPERTRESERIDARSHEVLARLLAKDRIIDALFRGELTLDQSVRRFREITESDPEVAATMRTRHGGTRDEMYFRNVLGFAPGTAHYHPERAKVVLPRLEAEISRRFPPAGVAEMAVR